MANRSTPAGRNGIKCDADLGTGPITFYMDLDEDDIPNEDNDGASIALESNDSFPIHRFKYFGYGDVKAFNFLNVTVNGAVINKIAMDKNYIDSHNYDLTTSFDIFNNYRTSGRDFYQMSPVIYINDEENTRTGYHGSICASDFGLTVPVISVQTVPL